MCGCCRHISRGRVCPYLRARRVWGTQPCALIAGAKLLAREAARLGAGVSLHCRHAHVRRPVCRHCAALCCRGIHGFKPMVGLITTRRPRPSRKRLGSHGLPRRGRLHSACMRPRSAVRERRCDAAREYPHAEQYAGGSPGARQDLALAVSRGVPAGPVLGHAAVHGAAVPRSARLRRIAARRGVPTKEGRAYGLGKGAVAQVCPRRCLSEPSPPLVEPAVARALAQSDGMRVIGAVNGSSHSGGPDVTSRMCEVGSPHSGGPAIGKQDGTALSGPGVSNRVKYCGQDGARTPEGGEGAVNGISNRCLHQHEELGPPPK